MADTVIRVENLSKRYILNHQQEGQGKYKTLQDTMVDGAKSLVSAIQNPLASRRKALSKIQNSSREEFWAVKDMSFEIKQGDRVGIIGRNGAGKSTLLKLLSRIVEPTHGQIEITGRVASLLEVGTGFHPELTGRENIYLNGAILGMGREEIKRKFDEIVAFAEVEKFLDTPVKRYSSGMYVRLAFAVAAHLEPEILIVDEVLAVGDIEFQQKCLGKMEEVGKEGRTVLFVSHNLSIIKKLCNTGILLEAGALRDQGYIGSIINTYDEIIFHSNTEIKKGIIYESSIVDSKSDYCIYKIEMLDERDEIKASLSTWDYVKFRIHYSARITVQQGSGVLSVTTLDNTNLLMCSTRPDQNVQMQISKGQHYFDCVFKEWPLAAGQYLLQAGLAVPMREWLCQTGDIIPLKTEPKDIFNSGMPPEISRCLIAASYKIFPEVTSND